MNLLDLRAKYPGLFYSQSWFLDEPFMRALPNETRHVPPDSITAMGEVPKNAKGLWLAVDLAHAYVKRPADPIWRNKLWCRDTDRDGQRVYLTDNGKGLEVHRHLHITESFGVPTWA